MDHHVMPIKEYLTIFGALIALTFATVIFSFIPFPPTIHLFGAILIACVKTTLIVLYFMHVRYSGQLIQMFAAMGFFFVIIFMVIMMADYMSQFSTLTPTTNAIPFDTF